MTLLRGITFPYLSGNNQCTDNKTAINEVVKHSFNCIKTKSCLFLNKYTILYSMHRSDILVL